MFSERSTALQVPRAVTRLTAYRPLNIRSRWVWTGLDMRDFVWQRRTLAQFLRYVPKFVLNISIFTVNYIT